MDGKKIGGLLEEAVRRILMGARVRFVVGVLKFATESRLGGPTEFKGPSTDS